MVTANEVTTLMYEIVNSSGLSAAINGAVYKDWRPINSVKEDIVINTIAADVELIQDARLNVNIHLPSVNTPDGLMPNNARFDTLGAIAKAILETGQTKYFTYYLEQTALIKEQSKDEWYLNFRIRFSFHNTIN